MKNKLWKEKQSKSAQYETMYNFPIPKNTVSYRILTVENLQKAGNLIDSYGSRLIILFIVFSGTSVVHDRIKPMTP